MTLAQIVERWEVRRDDYKRVGASINGALVCQEFLTDLSLVEAAELEPAFKVRAAASRTGYSEDHLGRLVRQGKIPNVGRPGAPLVRLSDIPTKDGALPNSLSDSRLSPTDIARVVVHQQEGRAR